MDSILIPGRFQPFHRGHFANVVRMVDLGYSPVKVAVRDVPRNRKNPWNAKLVQEIIQRTCTIELPNADIQVHIVPDLCDNWADEVVAAVGDFTTIAAGNPNLKKFFKGYKIIHTPRKDNPYSATAARKIFKIAGDLESMCLPSTVKIMVEMGIISGA